MAETDWTSPWPWPEPRLRYANATLPEILLAAGGLLGDADAEAAGLRMLGWLLDVETTDGHLSITPVGGWALGRAAPGLRPAAHRGGGPGRRLRPGLRDHR